jgi:hypothetical protein
MVTSPSRAALPSGALNNPRTPAQKLAMQAADQTYCLSLTLKTHNKLDHMILPARERHPEHPCWIPVRPQFAELVHTFNDELVRQLAALMQTLDALQALMADEQPSEPADHGGDLVRS